MTETIICSMCEGKGKVPGKRTRGKPATDVRCPKCLGTKSFKPSLPEGREIFMVASDVGATRPMYLERMADSDPHHYTVPGIPSLSGTCIAKHAGMVYIEQANGVVVPVHFDAKAARHGAKRREKKEKVDVNEGLYE